MSTQAGAASTYVTDASKARLDRALTQHLATLPLEDLDDVRIDTVAELAGVSRSTAYRHFGDRDSLLRQAALEIGRQQGKILLRRFADFPTIAAKIEESFANTARLVKANRMSLLLDMSRDRREAHSEVLQVLSLEIMGPEYLRAQQAGQLRADLTVEEIVDWLASQRELMLRLELEEPAARRWVRQFVVPVLRPQTDDGATGPEISATLAEVEHRLALMHELVERTHRALVARDQR
jgi:AcrR family transcriptional regulator